MAPTFRSLLRRTLPYLLPVLVDVAFESLPRDVPVPPLLRELVGDLLSAAVRSPAAPRRRSRSFRLPPSP